MFETFIVIVIVLACIVIGILAFAATKPNTLRVHRSASIKAAPEKIFACINDFHKWTQWSPYEKKDPNMKKSYSGAASGKGAVYEWDGNGHVGKGRIEIADSLPSSKITMNLFFEKPFKGQNVVDFILSPKNNATEVTWDMRGQSAFMAKVASIFIDMDKMIGGDFEAGLANLKAITEA